MRCVRCDKKIELHRPDKEEDLAPEELPSQMWLDGGVHEFAVGYGSDFDGNIYAIALCDDCIRQRSKDGALVFIRDYLFD